ncbi:MAG: hypothetical protein JXB47_08310 [Anaerolineae bacterium]|nr:hypothetical protein [Anaerolineae bacterium]
MSDDNGFDYTQFGFDEEKPPPRGQAPKSAFTSDMIDGITGGDTSSGDEDTLAGLLLTGLLLGDRRSRRLLDIMGVSNAPGIRLARNLIGLAIFLFICLLFACCLLITGGLSGSRAMADPPAQLPGGGVFEFCPSEARPCGGDIAPAYEPASAAPKMCPETAYCYEPA